MTSKLGILLRLIAIALCGMLLAGCGGSSNNATSGTAATSGSAGVAASEPTQPEPNAIDLCTLPALEHAKLTIHTAQRIVGTSNDKAATIAQHYREALEKLGWKLSSPMAKGTVTDDFASALLAKEADSIFVSVNPMATDATATKPKGQAPAATKEVQFSVEYLGTCDSSKLPRLPGAEKGFDDVLSSVYFTDMGIVATLDSLRNMLVGAGWQEFENPLVKKFVTSKFARAEYRKAGNSLHVTVSELPAADAKTAPAKRTSVKYTIGAIGHQLPAPPDATDVEFDDAQWLLRCDVPRDLEQVAKYYITTMAKIGFRAPQNMPYSETSMVINCESKEKGIVIVKLSYAGLNTRVEMQGMAEEGRKGARKPEATRTP